MRRIFFRSVAALALVIAPVVAYAQAPGGGGEKGGAEKGGAMERGGGMEKGGAMERGGAKGGEKAQSAPGEGSPGTGSPANTQQRTGGKDAGAEPTRKADEKGAAAPAAKATEPNGNERAAPATPKEGGSGREKSGAAAARGAGGSKSVQITSEQRTRISTTIRSQHVQALHGVSFAVNVGTVVPTRYAFHPLPPSIIEFVPEYRGFDYILVDDQIIVIEPGTRRIVEIIVL